jgi:hypothetical protein
LTQDKPPKTIADIFVAVLHDTAQFAGQLDTPINGVIQEEFRRFCMPLMQYGIDIERLSHGADIPDFFPSVSHATMSDELRQIGQTIFIQRLREIRRNDRFVNLVCDAGTEIHFKIMHAALSHPSQFSIAIPLEPCENLDWNSDQYESFFGKTVTALLQMMAIGCWNYVALFAITSRLRLQVCFISSMIWEDQGRELRTCVVSIT